MQQWMGSSFSFSGKDVKPYVLQLEVLRQSNSGIYLDSRLVFAFNDDLVHKNAEHWSLASQIAGVLENRKETGGWFFHTLPNNSLVEGDRYTMAHAFFGWVATAIGFIEQQRKNMQLPPSMPWRSPTDPPIIFRQAIVLPEDFDTWINPAPTP